VAGNGTVAVRNAASRANLDRTIHVERALGAAAARRVFEIGSGRLRAYLFGTLPRLPIPIALVCMFFDMIAAALHIRWRTANAIAKMLANIIRMPENG
jgi:hypothetical protein